MTKEEQNLNEAQTGNSIKADVISPLLAKEPTGCGVCKVN